MTPEQEAVYRKLFTDYEYFAEHNLWIKPKTGEPHLFIFNKAQKYLHYRAEAQRKRIGKVRMSVIKGRQQGCSTYINGRGYHKTALQRFMNAAIIAHETSGTNSMYKMVKRFHELSSPELKPSLTATNAKEFLFSEMRSGYSLMTAGNKNAGRSQTNQFVHWSEVAYSPNPSDIVGGLLETVPDVAGTEIWLESTSAGPGDFFHRRICEGLSGESDWETCFLPWHWQDEYKADATGIELTPHENKLLELYGNDGLTVEHLAWRRKKIRDRDGDELLFAREYPFSVEEAFTAASDDAYISPIDVREAINSDMALDNASPLIIGADPSRLGGDRFAVCFRRGRTIHGFEVIKPGTITETAGRLAELIDKLKPTKLFIDVGGLGVGVYDILVNMGYGAVVVAVNFGGKARKDDRFYDKRSEMYGDFNHWLQNKPVRIHCQDVKLRDRFINEISSPKKEYTGVSQLKLESKKDMKKRGLPSPDLADSAVLTFAEPVADPATIRHNHFNRPQFADGAILGTTY